MTVVKPIHHRSHLVITAGAKLMAYLLVFLASLLLFASNTQAMQFIGDCYDNKHCDSHILSSLTGEPKVGNELFINTTCDSFWSNIGPPTKADLCTKTACTRLGWNQCYSAGGYKSVEFVQ